MYKSVDSKDKKDWIVVDLDKRETIKRVQWADDKKGEYQVVEIEEDKNGNNVYTSKKGNIKLIKIDWKYWIENNRI